MADEPLTSDQKAAEKAANDHEKAVVSAILAALLALRSQVTISTWWMPDIWDEFRRDIAAAIDPAFNAFDKSARAVWMGYDSLDAETLEMQRRIKERFVQEFGDSTKRAVDRVVAWGQLNGVSGDEMDRLLSNVVGLNSNQINAAVSDWTTAQDATVAASVLSAALAAAAKKAAKDRSRIVATDLLWDAVQAGRVAGGIQEQRATNAQVVKTWFTQLGERVCGVCGPLHGVSVPIRSQFPGGFIAPKAHSHCRCWAIIGVAKEGRF